MRRLAARLPADRPPFDEETLFSLGEVIEQAAAASTPARGGGWRFQGRAAGRPPAILRAALAAAVVGGEGEWERRTRVVQVRIYPPATPPGFTPASASRGRSRTMPAIGIGRRDSPSRRMRWNAEWSGSRPPLLGGGRA